MKKVLITLLLIYLGIGQVKAYDFYPELGIDPMYSQLNPMADENKSEEKTDDSDSLFTIIKNKFHSKKEKDNDIDKSSDEDLDM